MPQLKNTLALGLASGIGAWQSGSCVSSTTCIQIFRRMSWKEALSTLAICLSAEIVVLSLNPLQNKIRSLLRRYPPTSLKQKILTVSVQPFFSALYLLSYGAAFYVADQLGYKPPLLTPALGLSLARQIEPFSWSIKKGMLYLLYPQSFLVPSTSTNLLSLACNAWSHFMLGERLEEKTALVRPLLLSSMLAARLLNGAFHSAGSFDRICRAEALLSSDHLFLLSMIPLAFVIKDWVQGELDPNKSSLSRSVLGLCLFGELVRSLNRDAEQRWKVIRNVIPEEHTPTDQQHPQLTYHPRQSSSTQIGTLSRIPDLALKIIADYMQPQTLENFVETHKQIFEVVAPDVLENKYPRLCSIRPEKICASALFSICMRSFGPDDYTTYLGVTVDQVTPLPAHIQEILAAPCPFSRGKQVKDTHILVLLPATVNGTHLTLNKLRELTSSPTKEGIPASFDEDKSSSHILSHHGTEKFPDRWVLLYTAPLPQTQNKTFSRVTRLLTSIRRPHSEVIHSRDLGSPVLLKKIKAEALRLMDYLDPTPVYTRADILEAAPCSLLNRVKTGHFLFSEGRVEVSPSFSGWISWRTRFDYHLAIGDFQNSGLVVNNSPTSGVSAARKFY